MRRGAETKSPVVPAAVAAAALAAAATASSTTQEDVPAPLPLLRVVVLDGVYPQARNMFRAMRTRLPPSHVPPHVALHPRTLSVYHRATKNFGRASAADVTQGPDPDALHICTVEAYALLLRELGEGAGTSQALVDAVVANNAALRHEGHVRPPGGMAKSRTSGTARKRRSKAAKAAGLIATGAGGLKNLAIDGVPPKAAGEAESASRAGADEQ